MSLVDDNGRESFQLQIMLCRPQEDSVSGEDKLGICFNGQKLTRIINRYHVLANILWDVSLSKRTLYPTSSPMTTSVSAAIRSAALVAAIRRGRVQEIWHLIPLMCWMTATVCWDPGCLARTSLARQCHHTLFEVHVDDFVSLSLFR